MPVLPMVRCGELILGGRRNEDTMIRYHIQRRNLRILRLVKKGVLSPKEIATKLMISKWCVYRAIRSLNPGSRARDER